MRAVIQRVKHASVTVDGKMIGSCQKGYLILLGVANGDTEKEAEQLCKKILNLRIFEDENGKMNLSLLNIQGELLIVSQFTLLANYRNGNRPDFILSANPIEANRLYEYFITLAKKEISHVEHGQFGADMQVEILNDGPVTICMDTDVLNTPKGGNKHEINT